MEIESAGMEPANEINPLVVQVMAEEGIDLSHKKPRDAFELHKAGNVYDYIIAIYYSSLEKCHNFPGITTHWYWSYPNPDLLEGTHEEKLEKVREIRNMIKDWIVTGTPLDT